MQQFWLNCLSGSENTDWSHHCRTGTCLFHPDTLLPEHCGMSQLPSRKTDLVALKSVGRVTTDFNSSRVKPRVTQFFSEILPLFRYTVSVSFTYARDTQGSYGVRLAARQTTVGGEQRGGQGWA